MTLILWHADRSVTWDVTVSCITAIDICRLLPESFISRGRVADAAAEFAARAENAGMENAGLENAGIKISGKRWKGKRTNSKKSAQPCLLCRSIRDTSGWITTRKVMWSKKSTAAPLLSRFRNKRFKYVRCLLANGCIAPFSCAELIFCWLAWLDRTGGSSAVASWVVDKLLGLSSAGDCRLLGSSGHVLLRTFRCRSRLRPRVLLRLSAAERRHGHRVSRLPHGSLLPVEAESPQPPSAYWQHRQRWSVLPSTTVTAAYQSTPASWICPWIGMVYLSRYWVHMCISSLHILDTSVTVNRVFTTCDVLKTNFETDLYLYTFQCIFDLAVVIGCRNMTDQPAITNWDLLWAQCSTCNHTTAVC